MEQAVLPRRPHQHRLRGIKADDEQLRHGGRAEGVGVRRVDRLGRGRARRRDDPQPSRGSDERLGRRHGGQEISASAGMYRPRRLSFSTESCRRAGVRTWSSSTMGSTTLPRRRTGRRCRGRTSASTASATASNSARCRPSVGASSSGRSASTRPRASSSTGSMRARGRPGCGRTTPT